VRVCVYITEKRFNYVTDERLYVVATVVDPRYLGRLFGAPELVSAKQWLVEECTTAAAAAVGEDREAEEQTEPPAKRQRVDDAQPDSWSVLDACLNQILAFAEPAASEQNSVEMEIERFISVTPVDRSQFPTACDWWRENHHLYPNVARVAKRYLSAPPTSIASERLFSSASRVFTDRRNRLAPKKADMLLFIKHNLPLISFKY